MDQILLIGYFEKITNGVMPIMILVTALLFMASVIVVVIGKEDMEKVLLSKKILAWGMILAIAIFLIWLVLWAVGLFLL